MMNTHPNPGAAPVRNAWLESAENPECRERIWALGLLTGLRGNEQGVFTPANFERALVLDRLIRLRRPARILEIGTGRGLGCMSMAASARACGLETRITTLDIIPAETPQRWPIEVEGRGEIRFASRKEVWEKHLDPAVRNQVAEVIGPTTRTLPELAESGARFDLVFIDAGHDLYSVVHDLSYSLQVLAEGGAILMDDFAPMEEFGLGTCIAAQHAHRFFGKVEIFPTEGLVFGGAEHPEAPRGMVLLSESRLSGAGVNRWKLLGWKVAGWMLRLCHAPQAFPSEPRVER